MTQNMLFIWERITLLFRKKDKFQKTHLKNKAMERDEEQLLEV